MAALPAPGAGTGCDERDERCGVPRDAQLELRFDRYLLPTSAVRQSLLVYTGVVDTAVFFEPRYDLVERALVLRQQPGRLLAPTTQYRVELVAQDPEDPVFEGLRAFDGADLSPAAPVPLTFNFFTAAVTTEDEPAPADLAATCRDVLAAFERAGCTSCHVDTERRPDARGACGPGQAPHPESGECVGVPRMGLDLSNPEGLRRTALGQVAHQAEVGPSAGVSLQNPPRLGVAMPILDPGHPGNSYLMYKLLLKPENLEGESELAVPLPSGTLVASAAERERLRDWFVRGEPMPPGDRRMPLADVRLVQRWLQLGAPLDSCE